MVKRLLALFFYKVISSGAYRNLKKDTETNAVKKSFKSIGADALLPERLTLINSHYITIGKNFSALDNLRLEAWSNYAGDTFSPALTIGDNVSVGADVHIGCINEVSIGSNVLMGSRIYISDHSHGEITADMLDIPPVKRPLISKGNVVIEDDVWVGDGVCILPGVHIGRSAVIGANTVVTKSVPARGVVAGVPGKIIKAF
jgi:acetyltransferase-like isoleucine patch superfamily enzyme